MEKKDFSFIRIHDNVLTIFRSADVRNIFIAIVSVLNTECILGKYDPLNLEFQTMTLCNALRLFCLCNFHWPFWQFGRKQKKFAKLYFMDVFRSTENRLKFMLFTLTFFQRFFLSHFRRSAFAQKERKQIIATRFFFVQKQLYIYPSTQH